MHLTDKAFLLEVVSLASSAELLFNALNEPVAEVHQKAVVPAFVKLPAAERDPPGYAAKSLLLLPAGSLPTLPGVGSAVHSAVAASDLPMSGPLPS